MALDPLFVLSFADRSTILVDVTMTAAQEHLTLTAHGTETGRSVGVVRRGG